MSLAHDRLALLHNQGLDGAHAPRQPLQPPLGICRQNQALSDHAHKLPLLGTIRALGLA
jgi:hypothetical protein